MGGILDPQIQQISLGGGRRPGIDIGFGGGTIDRQRQQIEQERADRERIRFAREQKGWTQQDAADEARRRVLAAVGQATMPRTYVQPIPIPGDYEMRAPGQEAGTPIAGLREMAKYSAPPSLEAMRQDPAMQSLPPDEQAQAVDIIRRQLGMGDEPQPPKEMQRELEIRSVQKLGGVSREDAEAAVQGAHQLPAIKAAEGRIEQAKEEQFRADVRAGKVIDPKTGEPPDPTTPKGRVVLGTEAERRGLPKLAKEYLGSASEIAQARREAQKPTPFPGTKERPSFHTETLFNPKDGQWHRYRYRVVTDPETGTTEEKRQDLGIAGGPGGAGGGGAQETRTETTRVTPRKAVTLDELKSVNAALPNLVKELGKERGIDLEKEYKARPSPLMLEFIKREMLKRFGTEAVVAWDGDSFRVVRAWTPAQREKIEGTRTTTRGPARGVQPPPEAPPTSGGRENTGEDQGDGEEE